MTWGACVMKSEKYKNFVAILIDGRKVPLKAPAGKVTEQTASKYARHWLKVQKGITGVDVVEVLGLIYI